MNVRKAIKKIVAIGAGVTMVGATIMGAMAALDAYPTNYITDGVFNGKVVVGENAATSDVVGAIDIAASLQAEAKTATEVSCAGTVSVTGGKTEDVPIGTALNNAANAFGASVDADDVPSMLSSTVDIDNGTIEDTYDVSDKLQFSAAIGPQTGTTYATNRNDDWTDKVFVPIPRNSINYTFVFDDALKTGNNLTYASNNYPIELTFLGKKLKITGAAATSITAQVGEEVFLQVGDTVEVVGKTVELKNVGNTGAVIVSVDGVTETIGAATTETVNGIKIKVDEFFYSDALAERSATLIVGEEASKTYSNNDAYIGEDKSNPQWRWVIANCNTASPTLAIKWDLNIDNTDEDYGPEHPLYEGEELCLPNNYLCVQFNSLKISDYQDYEIFAERNVDLYTLTTDAAPNSTSNVLVIKSMSGDNKGLVAADNAKETDKLYIYAGPTDQFWSVYYWDNNAGKAVLVNATAINTTANTIGQIKYKDTLLNIGAQVAVAAAGVQNLSITFLGDAGNNIVLHAEESANGSITYFGDTSAGTAANDVVYLVNLGKWEEDTRTGYGIIIKDPAADNDEFKMSVPSDVTEFKANMVVKGSGATTTSAGGGTSYTVVPIPVGLGALDKDVAAGASDLIVVGGPCANTVAADLMGNPDPCGEGFEAGKAVIKLFEDRNSVLVAGYEATETLGAAYVLADYEDYALSGTEVEVLVPSLSSISVNPVS
jgi:hypothetical protein